VAIEPIALNFDAVDAQAMYYALQKKLNAVWAITQLIAIVLPLLLFFSGWGAQAYELLRRHLRLWWSAAFALFFAIAFIALIAQIALIHFAITMQSELIESSIPSFSGFLLAKLPEAVATSALIGLSGILVCYLLDRKHRLMWLWLSVLATVLGSISLMATPALTETQPLGDTPVERRIVEMAGQLGIPISSIAKERCHDARSCSPGQVIGLGPTRLILLDDRLSAKTPDEQLLQVFAHEAKHYLLDNNLKPVFLIFLISSVVFLVTQTLSSAIVARHRAPYTSVAEKVKVVPLVFGLGLATFILLQPALNTYRQHVEFEADRFGLEFNRHNRALIEIMRSDAAANPMLFRFTPVTRYFRATHPEIRARIEFAESYHPWANNEPIVYAQYMGK